MFEADPSLLVNPTESRHLRDWTHGRVFRFKVPYEDMMVALGMGLLSKTTFVGQREGGRYRILESRLGQAIEFFKSRYTARSLAPDVIQ